MPTAKLAATLRSRIDLRKLALFSVALVCAVVAAGELRSTPAPPDPYVLSGYVPIGFEAFGAWTAQQATPLYAAPDSSTPVTTLGKCAQVIAENGEIRGRPRALKILRAHAPFAAGERLWILARDLEEGYFQLWYQGKVRDDLAVLLEEDLPGSEPGCSKPSHACWLWAERSSPQQHWVRIRTKAGTVGWTNRSEHFRAAEAEGNQCR